MASRRRTAKPLVDTHIVDDVPTAESWAAMWQRAFAAKREQRCVVYIVARTRANDPRQPLCVGGGGGVSPSKRGPARSSTMGVFSPLSDYVFGAGTVPPRDASSSWIVAFGHDAFFTDLDVATRCLAARADGERSSPYALYAITDTAFVDALCDALRAHT